MAALVGSPSLPRDQQPSQRGESSLLACTGGSAPAGAPAIPSPGYVNGAAATPGHWRACSWKCKYGRLGIAVCGETLTTSAPRPHEPFLFMTPDSRCSTIYRGPVDSHMGAEGWMCALMLK